MLETLSSHRQPLLSASSIPTSSIPTSILISKDSFVARPNSTLRVELPVLQSITMDSKIYPIIEVDEPAEDKKSSRRQPQHQPFVPGSPESPSEKKPDTTLLSVPGEAGIVPLNTPIKRIFDAYAFTPSRLIPRDKYTDKPSLWPPPSIKPCDFVPTPPELYEQYSSGHPSLSRAQSTTSVKTESELKRSVSTKETKSGIGKSLLGLKSAASESTTLTSESSSDLKLESQNVAPKSSVRRPLYRAKTLPIENHSPQRVSLVASGIKLPLNWGRSGPSTPPPKPFHTRLCDGCNRYLTMTKTQYICNDTECQKRICDRCYNMWLDSRYRGEVVNPERLQKAHTAAEFRERCAKGMLLDKRISMEEKAKYVGEASRFEVGYPFVKPGRSLEVGCRAELSRTKLFDLKSLKELFGKEGVEMTLRASSKTKESSITAKAGPGRFQRLPWAHVEPFDPVWGWDYAIEKRRAAAAGRAEPALPRVDYQPPTFIPPPPSPARTIVSTSSITIESSRAQTPTTVSSFDL
ncbi:hypothetical protein TWF694_003450 [Orbilia ellipsospora]|uniref:Uncharacterized protein n=1 Tax=Orbilia ellipsospora TaxID=2528407 RepID=A0AAV9WY91_9PEZI